MKTLTLTITLRSPALIGSGEGFGATIDADIVFDDLGIPLIPAKRVKGCLRDSAKNIERMFQRSDIDFPLAIDQTFGKIGEEFDETGEQICPVSFFNLRVEDYAANRAWLNYLAKKYPVLLSQDTIIETFTDLRQQTAIDEDSGVAKEHSLRTSRVIRKGNTFFGDLQIAEDDQHIIDTLALACVNFRYLGTQRNRGFGAITCQLFDENAEITTIKLEELCKRYDIR